MSADPAPDVNWRRGRSVLSKYDNKVELVETSARQLNCLLQDKYEMRTLEQEINSTGSGGKEVVRQFLLIIKDIREEDYGEIIRQFLLAPTREWRLLK